MISSAPVVEAEREGPPKLSLAEARGATYATVLRYLQYAAEATSGFCESSLFKPLADGFGISLPMFNEWRGKYPHVISRVEGGHGNDPFYPPKNPEPRREPEEEKPRQPSSFAPPSYPGRTEKSLSAENGVTVVAEETVAAFTESAKEVIADEQATAPGSRPAPANESAPLSVVPPVPSAEDIRSVNDLAAFFESDETESAPADVAVPATEPVPAPATADEKPATETTERGSALPSATEVNQQRLTALFAALPRPLTVRSLDPAHKKILLEALSIMREYKIQKVKTLKDAHLPYATVNDFENTPEAKFTLSEKEWDVFSELEQAAKKFNESTHRTVKDTTGSKSLYALLRLARRGGMDMDSLHAQLRVYGSVNSKLESTYGDIVTEDLLPELFAKHGLVSPSAAFVRAAGGQSQSRPAPEAESAPASDVIDAEIRPPVIKERPAPAIHNPVDVIDAEFRPQPPVKPTPLTTTDVIDAQHPEERQNLQSLSVPSSLGDALDKRFLPIAKILGQSAEIAVQTHSLIAALIAKVVSLDAELKGIRAENREMSGKLDTITSAIAELQKGVKGMADDAQMSSISTSNLVESVMELLGERNEA